MYRLDYELETGPGFVAVRFAVMARGDGWRQSLDMQRSASGTWEETWREDGACKVLGLRRATDLDGLAGAFDVDLGLSPLLNTPPVLRHGLLRGGSSVDFMVPQVTLAEDDELIQTFGPDRFHEALRTWIAVWTLRRDRDALHAAGLQERGPLLARVVSRSLL